MKNKLTALAVAMVSILLMTSCQNKKTAGKTEDAAKTEVASLGITKEEIVKMRESMPTYYKLAELINQTGAAYLAGMTMENLDPKSLLTRTDKAQAMGYLLFDLGYTGTYQQIEARMKLFKIYQTVVEDMGMGEMVEMVKEHVKDMEAIKDNPDQLPELLEKYIPEARAQMERSGSPKDLALITAAGLVKSLHVISYITLFSEKKEPLMEVLKNQRTSVNAIQELLAKVPEDADLKKYLDVLTPINTIFQSAEPMTIEQVDQINKLTSTLIK